VTLDVGESADLDIVYDDRGVSATYRHHADVTVDVDALSESSSPTDDEVTVLRDAKRERSLAMEGRMVAGERLFRVRSSELSATPAPPDELVVGSTTWQVRDWELDMSELEYELQCRKVD